MLAFYLPAEARGRRDGPRLRAAARAAKARAGTASCCVRTSGLGPARDAVATLLVRPGERVATDGLSAWVGRA